MTKHRLLFFVMALCSLVSCHNISVKQVIRYSRPVIHGDTVTSLPDTTALHFLKFSRVISIYELMSQHWEMEDADKKHWNEFFWDTLRDKRIYSSLYLFADSTFTENPRAFIAMGKWILNKPGRELILLYPNRREKEYLIWQFNTTKLVTTWERDGEQLRFEFSADNMVHIKAGEDPFHPSNNRWRIKPQSAESEKQVRARVKDCVHFYSLFFKDNRERKEKNISFDGLPNCFTWYNGGISLQPTFELDKKWIECFYSQEQAQQGYDMIKTVLDKHALKWPQHAGGWIEELQSILGQIHEQL